MSSRNVEIKARVHDVNSLIKKAIELCKMEAVLLEQSDTFFKTEKGRLKLREFKEGHGELIYYERPDFDGPKISNYSKSMVADPTSLKQVLAMALGVQGYVKKKRMLFHYNHTRIHIDDVSNLGKFMEIEAVLDDDQTLEDGTFIAQELLKNLGVSITDLVSGSYLDSLNKIS